MSIQESPYKLLAETNTIISGRRGFATRDLFEKHPRKEGLWRLCGRADDQIMHSTGEKASLLHPYSIHPTSLYLLLISSDESRTNWYAFPVVRSSSCLDSRWFLLFCRIDLNTTPINLTRSCVWSGPISCWCPHRTQSISDHGHGEWSKWPEFYRANLVRFTRLCVIFI